MKPIRGITLVCVVVSLLLAGAAIPHSQTASAAGGITWVVNSLDSIGCNEGNTGFTTTLSGYTGGPERFRTIVDAAGLRYMDEDAGVPSSNGTYGWHLYASNSGGPTTGTWPLPSDTPITVDFMIIDGVGGPAVYKHRVTLSQCNGGTIISDVVLIAPASEEPVVDEPVPGCDVLINIPSSAVGATIIADTPAYWAPGEATDTVLKAGTNVRAISLTGGYYEILFACNFLYVPARTLGPNFDSPWNGAPLPTN